MGHRGSVRTFAAVFGIAFVGWLLSSLAAQEPFAVLVTAAAMFIVGAVSAPIAHPTIAVAAIMTGYVLAVPVYLWIKPYSAASGDSPWITYIALDAVPTFVGYFVAYALIRWHVSRNANRAPKPGERS